MAKCKNCKSVYHITHSEWKDCDIPDYNYRYCSGRCAEEYKFLLRDEWMENVKFVPEKISEQIFSILETNYSDKVETFVENFLEELDEFNVRSVQ